MSARISSLPVVVSANIADTDILPIVVGIASNTGVTKRVSVSELRLKLGTTPPAGGRTVTSAATYLANNAVYNVKDFGAFGDGVTNDAVAVQAAVTAAQASGGRVYFPRGTYFVSTTTITITANAVVLEAENPATYIKYSGTGYAVSFALAGAAQMHDCGVRHLGILVTNIAGNGYYAKSPYGFFVRDAYLECGITNTTSVGVTIDGGLSSGGTGYFATHNIISHVRCNGFLKGILFKGGSLSGWDITTASTVEYAFVNSLVGLTGSVGIEFQGSQQCTVLGGNFESLDRGIKLTSTPSRCIGITLDSLRFEAIAVANWDIAADATGTAILNPSFTVDNGNDLAADTNILTNSILRFNGKNLSPSEGTWTPTMIGDGVAGVQTYSLQKGQYTKVGRQVTITCYVSISAKGGTMAGNVKIGGLPFAAINTANALAGVGIADYGGVTLPAGRTQLGVETIANATELYLITTGSAAASALLPVANIAAATYFIFSMSYISQS